MEDKNPFKFGSVVDGPYFTNRTKEVGLVKRVLAGENHLILVSPRRYDKTTFRKDPVHLPVYPYNTQKLAYMAWEIVI